MPPTHALLGLGSNVGDRDGQIRAALRLLEERGVVRVLRTSRVRTTAPVGGPPQDDFRNAAALVESSCSARALLAALKDVERALGRAPGGELWGPRTVDVDLLLFGAEVIREPGLEVPHPRMAERAFVLEPAADVAPEMRHPVLGRTVRELWEELS